MKYRILRQRVLSTSLASLMVLSSLAVIVVFAPTASAAVTTGVTVDLVNSGSPYVRDDSSAYPIWGFGATSNTGLDRLWRVEVWFDTWSTSFNTNELENLNNNGAVSGVALFRDNGAVDDVLDANDAPIVVSNIQWIWSWPYDYCRMDLNTVNEFVPVALTGSYQWFIVIRTDNDIDDNDVVRTWIDAGGIDYSDGSSQPNFNLGGSSIDVVESRYWDIGSGSIGRSLSQAALGINIVDGGSYDYLDYIFLQFQNDGGFDFNDLANIGTNPSTSGVALYRDDGSSNDVWDASDTGLTLSAVTVNAPALTVGLDVNAEPVPNSPTGRYEYFIVIRTSATIANNDAFTIWADVDSIRVDGTPNPSDQNLDTPEGGNNDWVSYVADLLSPSISSTYWSESSSYLHVIGNTLWFSHQATWTQSATFNVLASDNPGGSGMYYADFSAEPSLGDGGGTDGSSPYQYSYSIDSWDTAASSPATATMYDRAGNSVSVNLPYALDTTAPSVTITTPAQYEVLSGIVTMRATASDAQSGVGTTYAQLTWDYGMGWAQMTWDGSAYTVDLDTRSLSDGEHRMLVQVWDNVYNTGSAQVIVKVDNTGPSAAIVWPNSGRYVMASGSLDVYAALSDSASVTSVQCRVDGGGWSAMTYLAQYGMWRGSLNDVGAGNHLIEVRGTDSEGNVGPTAGVIVIGDATAPTVSLVSPYDGQDVSGTITIRVSASDAERLGTVMVYVGPTVSHMFEATYNPVTGMYEVVLDTRDLSDGTWSVVAIAQDEAGWTSQTSVYTITVDNNEPMLAISQPVQGSYLQGTYTVRATATDVGAGFDIGGVFLSVDGGDWVAMTLSGGVWSVALDTTALADGMHTLTVVALDDAGNYAARAVQVYIDNTAPSVGVMTPYADQRVEGTFTFAVSATDNIGLRDVTARITGPSWTIDRTLGYNAASGYYEWTADTRLWPDGDYTITPSATELTGRAFTAAAAVAFHVDNNAPELTVSAPADGEVIISPVYIIAITAADGPFGVDAAAVEYRVDAGNWRTMNAGTTPAWSVTWDTTEVADGAHTITFRATDLADKTTERTVSVTVDNHDPTVALNTPSEGEYVGGVYTFTARAADLLGVWSVEMHFGFSSPSTLERANATYDPSSGYWELTVDTTTLPDGPASIVLQAVDTSGRTTTTVVIPFAVDNHMPELTVASPSPGEVVIDGDVNISVVSTDMGFNLGTGDVQYNLDGTGWVSLPQDITAMERFWVLRGTMAMADGEHVVWLRVTDGAGHVSSATATFVVDNTDPVCRVVSPAEDEYAMGVYHFRVSASDRLGISEVFLQLDGVGALDVERATYNPASGYWEFLIDTTTLPDAAAEVSAWAVDTSGRVSLTHGPVAFTIDNSAPMVAFATPAAGAVIVSGAQDVTLDVTDEPFELSEGDIELSIDGGGWFPVPMPEEGVFEFAWNTGLVSDAAHVLAVRATDAAGHVSEARVDVIVDNHDPTLGVVAPTEGQYAHGVLLFKVAASDARGIVGVTLDWADGSPVMTTLNAASNYYEYTLDTTTLADGSYTLVATAVDGSGRQTTIEVAFQVDNHEPELVLEGPLNGAVLDGIVTVTADARDTFIDTLQFSVDGVGWVDMVDGSGSFNSALFSDGTHTVIVRAIDGSGKEVHTSSVVTLDNTAPAMSIASFPSPGEHVAGDVPFSLFARDAVGVTVVSAVVGDDTYPVYLNPATGFYEWALPSLLYPDGALSVEFVAMDGAMHNSTLHWTVVVDNTAPDVLSMVPADGASVEDDVEFKVDASDATDVASVHIRIGADPWVAMTKQESGLWLHVWETTTNDNEEDLAYTVRVTDTLGNTKEVGATITVDNPNYAWLAVLIVVFFVGFGIVFMLYWRRRQEAMGAVGGDEGEVVGEDKGKVDDVLDSFGELEEVKKPEGPPADEVEVELEEREKL